MSYFKNKIKELIHDQKPLFYNNSGSKTAYQLGVKHLGSSEYLGFSTRLPNNDLLINDGLYLVDFESEEIVLLSKGERITPIKLQGL